MQLRLALLPEPFPPLQRPSESDEGGQNSLELIRTMPCLWIGGCEIVRHESFALPPSRSIGTAKTEQNNEPVV